MTYIASAGESFDSISAVVYGDEDKAHEIISRNGKYAHKIRFEGGEKLEVPELNLAATNSLPPWKRG